MSYTYFIDNGGAPDIDNWAYVDTVTRNGFLLANGTIVDFDGDYNRMEMTANMPIAPGALSDGFITVYNYNGMRAGVYTAEHGTDSASLWDIVLWKEGQRKIGIVITGYRGSDGNVTIPANLDGAPVLALQGYDGKGERRGIFGEKAVNGVTIPSGLICIGNSAFYHGNLSSVTIPNTVTLIGDRAFAGNKLTGLSIPGSVATIRSSAFNGNELTSLTLGTGVTHIGLLAFGYNKLTALALPASLKEIGYMAFYNNALTTITIPGGVASVLNMAFGNNPANRVTIGANVQVVRNAFDSSLAYYYDGNNKKAGTYLFRNRGMWPEISQLSDELFVVGGVVLGYFGSSKSITIPSVVQGQPVTAIGNNAFLDNGLTSVNIPSSVTSIGNYAFFKNNLQAITIPPNVTSIGQRALYGNKLTTLIIPASVTHIDDSAMSGNGNLTTISVASGNPMFSGRDGVLFSKDGTVLIAYPPAKGPAYSIPYGTKTIGNRAFEYSDITGITIPSSVTDIGDNAFWACELTSINIPSSVTAIGDYAFCWNELTAITIPPSVTTIGEGAFDSNRIESVTIGANVRLGYNCIGRGFEYFYEESGKKAGVYTYADWEWK
jgi:hypothetical protein